MKKLCLSVCSVLLLIMASSAFSMTPEEQFGAVKDIRANGWKLLGNWHSHPNSPSRMSEEDKRLAFDIKLSYLILSLAEAEPVLKCFNINKDRQVNIEELSIT